MSDPVEADRIILTYRPEITSTISDKARRPAPIAAVSSPFRQYLNASPVRKESSSKNHNSTASCPANSKINRSRHLANFRIVKLTKAAAPLPPRIVKLTEAGCSCIIAQLHLNVLFETLKSNWTDGSDRPRTDGNLAVRKKSLLYQEERGKHERKKKGSHLQRA